MAVRDEGGEDHVRGTDRARRRPVFQSGAERPKRFLRRRYRNYYCTWKDQDRGRRGREDRRPGGARDPRSPRPYSVINGQDALGYGFEPGVARDRWWLRTAQSGGQCGGWGDRGRRGSWYERGLWREHSADRRR